MVRLHQFRHFTLATLAAVVGGLSPSGAQTDSSHLFGSFLTGRYAQLEYDFEISAENYLEFLEADPENLFVVDKLVYVLVNNGDKAGAYRYVRELHAAGIDSGVSELVQFAEYFELQQYQMVLDWLEEPKREGDLINAILQGWAYFGLGDVTKAIERFDELADSEEFGKFIRLHQALAYASVGDFASAEKALQESEDALALMLYDGELFYANLIAQLKDSDTVLNTLDGILETRAEASISDLRVKVAAGDEVDFDYEITARLGASTLFRALGHLYFDQDPYSSLVFFRLSQFLEPNDENLNIWIGQSLQKIGSLDLAEKTYRSISENSMLYADALAARSELLHEDGKTEESFSILAEFAEQHPNSPDAHKALGDALRRAEEYERAALAYDDAIALLGETEPRHWRLYFYRGICHERSGNWEIAKKDLRFSLELSPDQPLVLNYLGYSMVTMDEDLEEAERLIRRADELLPDNGYIIDSLGWILYRMGRFEEAVQPMERAVSILPSDPIVNDHLGDVYWMVGRYREAEFQWKRALSFDPEPDDAKKLRLKLDHGLNYDSKNE
ncbi:MAG: tetratricopeptide repeat protein [Albidovulum sp.]|nr:tetratricopeptide repeat protein [Albidovulum sp.]